MSVTEGKVTGIASIDLIATRVDKAEMTGTVRTNLPREALAESLRIAAAGVETAGMLMNLCVVLPAWLMTGIGAAETEEVRTGGQAETLQVSY